MPAKSIAQRQLMAIAEHHPNQLQSKNKKILGSMSKSQMHDYAATPEKDLPEKVEPKKPEIADVSNEEIGEPKAESAKIESFEKLKKLRALRKT